MRSGILAKGEIKNFEFQMKKPATRRAHFSIFHLKFEI